MKTVYFDVDTQNDFVLPSGALYAPGAEWIVGKVAALNRAARAGGSVVVSTVDAHAEDDAEFKTWPPHCVAGTLGQHKPDSTLLEKRLVLPSVGMDVRIDGFEQILLEKRHLDCFTNPNIGRLLEALQADRYVVYGVVTEHCVKFAANGLLATGKRVVIVEDAVCAIDEAAARAVLDEFKRKGGRIATARDAISD